jgi:hypothetical protein
MELVDDAEKHFGLWTHVTHILGLDRILLFHCWKIFGKTMVKLNLLQVKKSVLGRYQAGTRIYRLIYISINLGNQRIN